MSYDDDGRWPRHKPMLALAAGAMLMPAAAPAVAADAAEAGRRIEEVVVTAERRESTVSDTAISISAFDEGFLKDFNIRNQEDLQNYIPATTIQPYDASIRGVGRTARTLGGDPGVATYFNGVYSEDFGIASTEGGLHDLARVEVLRGPQGTLYGRNAVGGAINFVSNRPNASSWEGEVTGTYGNFDTREIYYLLSGPIVQEELAFRLTGSDRRRDGYIDDTSPFGKDINNYGDENYTLALEWTPTDRISVYARGNERSYRRRFNGGAGTMPIVVSENGSLSRDTSNLTYGRRIVDRDQANPWARDFFDASQPVFTYTHPVTGAAVEAQNVRPGVDARSPLDAPVVGPDGNQILDANGLPAYSRGNASGEGVVPNYAIGHPANRTHIFDRDDLDEDDLEIDTNGQYDEFFDHQAVQFNFVFSGDTWEAKYIFGYTDFFYDRNTDEDKTGSTRLGSNDFYVLQENHNWQHELQFTFDTERLSVTTGAFVYESVINQRLDLYDPIDTQGRFQENANYSGLTGGIAEFGGTLEVLEAVGALGFVGAQATPLLDINTAQRAYEAGTVPVDPANGGVTILAPWYGDTGTGLQGARHDGASTPGTFFAWDNDIETRAYAAYTQGEYQLSDRWALTLGVRYAKDEKSAEERLIGMQENVALTGLALFDLAGNPGAGTLNYILANPAGFAACGAGANLLCLYNAVNGAIDPTAATTSGIQVGDPGTNPGDEPIRFTGVPLAFNIYRPVENEWDVWTWRANIDFEPNPDTLLYLSATTGWRSGGYNLGFFSTATPEYDEENILAYELGYKGTWLDGRMQINSALYLYEYEDIQTSVTQSGGLLGTSTNIINFPEAETFGWEGEIMYLAGDNLTLGGNWSYTDAEFTEDFSVVDVNNPALPQSIFTVSERSTGGFDGASLPKIPEWKFTVWGNYTWPLGDAGTLDLYTTVGYTDDFYFNAPFQRELDRAPSFTRWDARVSWQSITENWQVSAFVNNITNKLGVRAVETEAESQNFLRTVTTTDPRVYGLSLTYRLQ